jgi:NhaP-type Na+/H+ or K+/H+ antiporter
MMGGLELTFSGKGLTVVLLTVGPQFGEAGMVAIISKFVFDLPWLLAIALGFCLGAVSPAVLVPSCMALHNENYGTKKGIPTTLIAASSFDDIAAITIFGVCITLLFEQIGVGES